MKKELSPPFKITNEILNFVYEIGGTCWENKCRKRI